MGEASSVCICGLVLRDAVEVPVGAEENLTVGNGWRRVARLAQVIHGQKFELLRIGPKNGGDASSARDIQPPDGHHHRTPALAAFEPLDPPNFPGLTFHALGSPWSRVDDEDVSTHDHAGANPLRLFLQPQPIGSGYVTSSAQLETKRRSVDRSRERDADFAADDRRRIHQISQWFRQSLAKPQAGTALRIAGDHLREHAAKDLILAPDPGNDGRTPRAPISFQEGFRTAGLIVFPEQFAGLQVKRSQKGPLTRTEVQDDLPAMEDRGGTVAIFITHFTEVRFPKFFAVEVVAKDPSRAVPDNHARAVSRGRGPAVRIRLVRRLNSGKLNRPHPKFLARSAVEAIQVSLLARVFRTSDKDAPMRNHGAAVTRT